MGRPRKYASAAERQAAYRSREAHRLIEIRLPPTVVATLDRISEQRDISRNELIYSMIVVSLWEHNWTEKPLEARLPRAKNPDEMLRKALAYSGGLPSHLRVNPDADPATLECNEPVRTPEHPTKSHVVKACTDTGSRVIRFGAQGVKGSPKGTARNKAFKARHAENIARGPDSAAWWADRVKWGDEK
jgi:hypothetical protein